MNQYIITEESICTIRDYILGAFYEGENKEKIYDLIKSEFSVMRSHPYQSERDKVLDELYEFVMTVNGMDHNTCLRIAKKIEELRLAGE